MVANVLYLWSKSIKKSKRSRSGVSAGHGVVLTVFQTIYWNKFVVHNVLQCAHCVLMHHLVEKILNCVTFVKTAEWNQVTQIVRYLSLFNMLSIKKCWSIILVFKIAFSRKMTREIDISKKKKMRLKKEVHLYFLGASLQKYEKNEVIKK